MIEKNIYVPIYDFDIHVINIDDEGDSFRLRSIMNDFGCDDESIDDECTKVLKGRIDGGCLFRKLDERAFLLILSKFSSDATRINIIGHEKRHIEDRILEYCSVEDIEAAAYLAGYLSEKLYINE